MTTREAIILLQEQIDIIYDRCDADLTDYLVALTMAVDALKSCMNSEKTHDKRTREINQELKNSNDERNRKACS